MKLYGSMKAISQHTSFLSRRLYLGMANLHHFNGSPLCVIYNDVPERCEYGNPVTQGGTVAFNLMKADGSYIGHSQVEKIANERGIFLRSGGLCNAGGIASYLQVEPWQFKRAWSAGHRCGEEGIDLVNGKPTGVVRASLGAMSTNSDVDTFRDFLADAFLEQRVIVDAPRASYLELSRFEDLNLAPMTYEVEHCDVRHDRYDSAYGSELIISSALKSVHEAVDPRSSRASSIPRKVISTPNFAPTRSWPKRPVHEPRHPPVSSSSFHYDSIYGGTTTDSTSTITPVGIMRYSSDIAPKPERPWIYQDRSHVASKEEKRGTLRFWKRRKSFSSLAGA